MSGGIPGGLTAKEFKLFAAEAGEWLLGTVKGAWNEKQTVSQIILDAVIGMIPVVGDVTAARDLIAVGTGLATSEEKRESTAQWVLLVILIFALIPVLGGVIKGVGRLSLRLTEIAAKDSVAAAKLADEIIAFLNRVGHKNAERWFKMLDVLSYERELITRFRAFCDTVIVTITRYVLRFHAVLPQSMIARLEQVAAGFRTLKTLGDSMIPKALKEFHQSLQRLQQHIHAGGVPPPSKAATLTAQTGQKVRTYVDEARLLEQARPKRIIRAGKYAQNLAAVKRPEQIRKVYVQEPGFPDLLRRVETVKVAGQNVEYYPQIAAAAGPIRNEMLEGETLYRAFGLKGDTFGQKVGESSPIGLFWGRGAPPTTAKEWRGPCAVLDEWNRNGWLSIVTIPKGVKVPACTSVVSEQYSKQIAGQYLEGGAKQAAITEFFATNMAALAKGLFARGGGKITLPNGIILEIRQSHWTGINGKLGYGSEVIPNASVTERLGLSELQAKVPGTAVQSTAKAAAADDRQNQQATAKGK